MNSRTSKHSNAAVSAYRSDSIFSSPSKGSISKFTEGTVGTTESRKESKTSFYARRVKVRFALASDAFSDNMPTIKESELPSHAIVYLYDPEDHLLT